MLGRKAERIEMVEMVEMVAMNAKSVLRLRVLSEYWESSKC